MEKNKAIFEAAISLIKKNKIATLLVDIDALKSIPKDIKLPEKLRLIFVTRSKEIFEELEEMKEKYKILLPEANMTQVSEISTALVLAVVNGLIESKQEQIMCLFGNRSKKEEENEPNGVDHFARLDIIKIFEPKVLTPITDALSIKSEKIRPEVLQKTIKLAIAFASEGKEGHPFGAIFVIGDTKKVLKLSQNRMPDISIECLRSILESGMKETLRQVSSMDGAVIIRGSGKLVAISRDLNAYLSDEKKLPQGLGTRHSHTAGITEVADCIAVVISQSSGTVTVFVHGEIVLQIEKTSPKTTTTVKD